MNNNLAARGKWPITILVIILITLAGWRIVSLQINDKNIQNFDDCVKTGHPVLESYPEQCIANGRTFVNTR